MNLKSAVIYWIHLAEHTDPSTEGYLGVSKNFEARMRGHLADITNKKHKNPHLTNAVQKYGWDNLLKDIILNGEEAYCYEIEFELRPKKAMGWNIAPGGHRGPGWTVGKKKSKESIIKKINTISAKNQAKRLERIEARKIRLEERERRRQAKELAKKERSIAYQIRRQNCAIKKEEQQRKREEKKLKKIANGTYNIEPSFKNRPICKSCNKNFSEINYHRNGKTYYRSICDECGRKKQKKKPFTPLWQKGGYKKKSTCDLCGFKSLFPSQITVYHIDGSLKNNQLVNLRSVCLNCVEVVKRKEVIWKRGDLEVDY